MYFKGVLSVNVQTLTTPSFFQMDRNHYGQQEEERREREIKSSIRDQDRSDLLSEH